MELILYTKGEFIPEFNGNAKLDPSDQIVVCYQIPTAAERQKLLRRPTLDFNYDKQGEVMGGKTTVEIDNTKICDNMVKEIRGLAPEVDGKKKPITAMKDLYSSHAAFVPLIEEIGSKMRKLLEECGPDEKN